MTRADFSIFLAVYSVQRKSQGKTTDKKGTKTKYSHRRIFMKRLPLKLDLQFFSEESHPFAEAPAPIEPHPFAADASESSFAKFTDVPNPLLTDFQAPETPGLQPQSQGPNEEPSAESQIEELDFGGRKVPVIDPVLYDLHKDYSHLTRTYQQTNQELTNALDLASQWQRYAESQERVEESTPQQNSPTNFNEIPAERQQQLNDEYMERMYENKFAADQWWNSQPEIVALNQERQRAEFQTALEERLAPFEEERQALQAQQMEEEFRRNHPDFDDYKDWMQYIYSQNPEIEQLPNGLEVLYAMAKVQSAPPQPTFEEMLADPQNQQMILQNEQIRGMVFQNYQQGKLQANQQLPNIMGTPVGSLTPMSAGEQAPKTLSEATRNWLRSTGQN